MGDKLTFQIVTSSKVRLVWPTLFVPKKYKEKGVEKGEPKYSCTFLLEPDESFNDIKKVAAAAAMDLFGTVKGVRFPFKKGDVEKTKAEANGYDGDFYAGKVVIRSTSQFQPEVVDAQSKPLLDHSRVHSGCYGYVEFNFVARTVKDGTDDEGNARTKNIVTAYFNFVMITNSGDRIAGRSAKDVFAGIKGKETDFDPTAPVGGDALDDEISL